MDRELRWKRKSNSARLFENLKISKHIKNILFEKKIRNIWMSKGIA
jgi:hypothetical protein